jgi:glucan endo-1,3-beta-glucosidase 5/6
MITGRLVAAKGVKYLDRKWCILKPSIGLDNQNVAPGVSYACAKGDCSSLGYKTSCSDLDARGNISYAFNSYYQMNDQDQRACDFNSLATVTTENPSTSSCRFIVMIEESLGTSLRLIGYSWGLVAIVPLLVIVL